MPIKKYEVGIIGHKGAGKTSFHVQFSLSHFITREPSPVACAEEIRKQIICDDKVYLIDAIDDQYDHFEDQLDNFGKEIYRSRLYAVDAVLILYSVTSRRSFERVRDKRDSMERMKDKVALMTLEEKARWGLDRRDLNVHREIVYCIVGSQCDLVSEREVSSSEGRELARELGCRFVEASAKTGAGVHEAFHEVIRVLEDESTVKEINSGRQESRPLRRSSRLRSLKRLFGKRKKQ